MADEKPKADAKPKEESKPKGGGGLDANMKKAALWIAIIAIGLFVFRWYIAPMATSSSCALTGLGCTAYSQLMAGSDASATGAPSPGYSGAGPALGGSLGAKTGRSCDWKNPVPYRCASATGWCACRQQ